MACESLKRYDEAIDFFNEAIRIKRNNWRLWYNKGVNLCNLAYKSKLTAKVLFFESITCYQEAVRLKPDCARCLNNLGAVTVQYSQTNENLLFAIKCCVTQTVHALWYIMMVRHNYT